MKLKGRTNKDQVVYDLPKDFKHNLISVKINNQKVKFGVVSYLVVQAPDGYYPMELEVKNET